MVRAVIRRAGTVVLAALLSFAVAWTLGELAGDPAERAARASGRLPNEDGVGARGVRDAVIAEARNLHDLDGGAATRVARFTARFAIGDWGTSWRDGRPVSAHLAHWTATFVRVLVALALAALLALAGGVAATLRPGAVGTAIGVAAAIALAVPPLWLAQIVVGVGGGDVAAIVVLAIAPAGLGAAHVRRRLVEDGEGPLAIAIRARGASEARVLARHVLVVAAPELLVVLAGLGAYLVGAAPVVERALALDGIGRALTTAAGSGDVPVLAALAGAVGGAVAFLYAAADIGGRAIDRRLEDA
jgi:ABC-type dipeptide/oligopeptide/nickel transport system permease component